MPRLGGGVKDSWITTIIQEAQFDDFSSLSTAYSYNRTWRAPLPIRLLTASNMTSDKHRCVLFFDCIHALLLTGHGAAAPGGQG